MRRALGALLVGVALLTSACADDPNSVAAQAKAGDRKGYVSGDGTIERLPAERRDTLIATPDRDGLRFDVSLQGPRETVFLHYPGHRA